MAARSAGGVFQGLYRLLYSKVFGVVIILAMAVVSLLGTVIVQAPASVTRDSAAKAQWLEQVRPRFGGWTGVLDVLGLFQLWTSPLFLVITTLLGLSIIACTTHRLPQLVQRAMNPRIHVSDRFFGVAQYRAEMRLDVAAADALAGAQQVLRGRKYRVLTDGKDPDGSFYADKNRFGPFGTALAHASFVIILLAFLISAFTGFEEYLDIPVGQSAQVGHETGLVLHVTSFNDTYTDEGQPLDYVSHVVAKRQDLTVAEQDIRVNTPLVIAGIQVHQMSYGFAAVMKVTDSSGKIVFSGGVPLKWRSNDQREAIGSVVFPGTDVEMMVRTPASGATDSRIPAGAAIIELLSAKSGEKTAAFPLEQGASKVEAGYSITFVQEARYTGLMARQDPGTIWMWIGSVLLIVGMAMTFGFPHRRLWVRVEEDTDGVVVKMASVDKTDSVFERQFRALAHEVSAGRRSSTREAIDNA